MNLEDVTVYGTVPSPVVAQVRDALAGMGNLRHVLSWAVAASPPRKPEHIIAQDEYTHDVVMWFEDGVYAVFDVT